MKYDFELNIETENSLSIIIRELKNNSTVLEFGPANGRLTRYMKEVMGCKVYLVELDEKAGREALQYGEDLVVGDIEQYEWLERYKNLKFDYIVFADVLEHLRDPLTVLIKAKGLLGDDGKVLVSVPNLAHNAVLIDLLNNKFEYKKTGLLDDTHIHFFTKTSLDKMIADAGLYTCKEMATYASVGTIEIENHLTDVEGINSGYWNSRDYGNIYQFIYVLSKNRSDTEKLVKKKDDKLYFLQVYYDDNKDFTEGKSVKVGIIPSNGMIKTVVKLPESAKIFRVDPINVNCVITDVVCSGIREHNARFVDEDIYYFDTSDPQLIVSYEEAVNEISIEYNIVRFDISEDDILTRKLADQVTSQRKKIDAVNRELQLQQQKYDTEIYNRDQQIIALQKELNEQKARADWLQQQRDLLESKKIYKIYKYFKRK